MSRSIALKPREITIARNVPPGLVVCAIALGTAALTLMLLTLTPQTAQFPQRLLDQSAVLLAIFAVSGCFVGLGRDFTLRLVFLAVQIMVVWITAIPYSNPFVLSVYLALAVIAEAMIVLPVPLVVTAAAVATGIVLTSPKEILAYGVLVPAPPLQIRLLFVLATMSFTGFTVVVRRVYLRAVQAEEMRERLEEAMSRLAEANMKLQHYATMAERQAMEEERKRIAQEVHDILGHTLTTVNMTLQAAIGMLGNTNQPKLIQMLGSAREHVKEGMLELRRALNSLSAVVPQSPYNKARVLELARNVSQATGLRIDVDFGNTGPFGGEQRAATIYRLVQEGITNAIRHGNATYVDIHFQDLAGGLMLYVRDNGRGLMHKNPGFGITTMQKRVLTMNGEVSIGPNQPQGTTLQVWLPTNGKE